MKKFSPIIIAILALALVPVLVSAQESPLPSPTPPPPDPTPTSIPPPSPTPSPVPTLTPDPTPNPYPPPSPGDDEALRETLLWLFGGGGACLVAYWLIGKLKQCVNLEPGSGWLADTLRAIANFLVGSSEMTRYTSLALSAGLACLAFALAVELEYVPRPGDGKAWIEQIFSIAFVAVMGSQVIHGRRKLRKRDAQRPYTIE